MEEEPAAIQSLEVKDQTLSGGAMETESGTGLQFRLSRTLSVGLQAPALNIVIQGTYFLCSLFSQWESSGCLLFGWMVRFIT